MVKEGTGPRRLIIRLNIAQPRKGDPEQLKAALLAEEDEEEEAAQKHGDRGEGSSRGSTPPPAGAGAPTAAQPQRARASLNVQLQSQVSTRSPAAGSGQPGTTPKPKGGVKFAAEDDEEDFGWVAGWCQGPASCLPSRVDLAMTVWLAQRCCNNAPLRWSLALREEAEEAPQEESRPLLTRGLLQHKGSGLEVRKAQRVLNWMEGGSQEEREAQQQEEEEEPYQVRGVALPGGAAVLRLFLSAKAAGASRRHKAHQLPLLAHTPARRRTTPPSHRAQPGQPRWPSRRRRPQRQQAATTAPRRCRATTAPPPSPPLQLEGAACR